MPAAAPKRAFSKAKLRGTLQITRYSGWRGSVYDVMFRSELDEAAPIGPLHVASNNELVSLLERLEVNFELPAVREALEDILRYGGGSIPDFVAPGDALRSLGLA